MHSIRFRALEMIQSRSLPSVPQYDRPASELFGVNVFALEKMRNYLSEEAYEKLMSAVHHGTGFSAEVADQVAHAMKIWALERGASHFTHWFQPLTGSTAEKHESFFNLEGGRPIEKFSGKSLVQQEPDASSFPSGGIRNTFEARGYTAWDPTSPAFIFENRFGKTLCIPTIFVSYTGEALDYKAPLLKSIALVEKAAVEVCQYFDRNVSKVTPTLGIEQEYFLVDKAWFELRPDLMLTGRTLVGSFSARGQQLEDHYFGAIPERVYGYMKEFETEAYKLGIPLTTRHNEVAPGQYECAPVFEELNIAIDHNSLLMNLMDQVARKHDLRVLFHEKPYAGINGSGKHNNWSLGTNTGKNLLSPGKNPKDNLQFLTFFINVVKAVSNHPDLLRAGIAGASNDHRLGANEAPPAIISIFTGSYMEKVLNEIETPSRRKDKESGKAYMKLGISKVPEILLDNTDRNRTSPFAFTGNKFEFRAVGSSANCAAPMIILNCIVAEQLIEFKRAVDRKVARGRKKENAILDILRQYVTESKFIRFDGNGYSKEWEEEAAKRGLSNIKTTPRALDAYTTERTRKLFSLGQVFTGHELEARHDIRLETYVKKIQIEGRVLNELVDTVIVPSALGYQGKLLANIQNLAETTKDKSLYYSQLEIVEEISRLVNDLRAQSEAQRLARRDANEIENIRDRAIAYSDTVVPYFSEIRAISDRLEAIVADDTWPLPKYREMLFIK